VAGSATLSYGDVEEVLRGRLGDGVLDAGVRHGQLVVKVPPQRRPEALSIAKSLGFTYYTFCGGVDWPDDNRLEVLDQVYAIEPRLRLTVRCDCPADDPKVPTAMGVYAGADWYERETWELLGIVFTGHPRLARLYLPDWFEGFPLRKDYVLASRVEKPWPGAAFEG
jgi:NADH-quinone oxidoreductase subunit C